VREIPLGSAQGRLSLRLKNGSGRDDAGIEDVARRNSGPGLLRS
jgi:hypothetical protein